MRTTLGLTATTWPGRSFQSHLIVGEGVAFGLANEAVAYILANEAVAGRLELQTGAYILADEAGSGET